MKSFLSTLLIALCLWGCTDKDESAGTGNIYGVVTVKSTAEPMRATGVELYYNNALLLKTVTYDDGHYEFTDLEAGGYELKVAATGYDEVTFDVIVEAGRTARADMQLEEIDTGVTVLTLPPTVSSYTVSFKGEFRCQYSVDWPTEYGFVYGKGSNPTINHDHIVKGTMTTEHGYFFIAEPTNLDAITTYYVRAYAKNKKGISYGEDRTFRIW